MIKKLLALALSFILLFAYAVPVMASTHAEGLSYYAVDTEDEDHIEQVEGSIEENFGIEVYYTVNPDLSGKGSAKEYAEVAIGNLTNANDVILYARTADESYMLCSGTADSMFTDQYKTAIYNGMSYYENAHEITASAVAFFDMINNLLYDLTSEGESGGGVPEIEMEPQMDISEDGTETASTSEHLLTTAADSRLRVVDNASLLSDDEERKLIEKLDEISERQQFDIVVVTTNTLDGKSAMAYADDYYDENGYGYGDRHDGCLLLVSMAERDWHISTTGFGITAITDYGISQIEDEVVPYLSEGEYYDAFRLYGDMVDDFVTEAKSGTAYDDNHPYNVGSVRRTSILISAVIGIIVALIITLVVKSRYKPVKFNRTAGYYLMNGSLNVRNGYDNFMYSNVTSRRIENDSSSSGGSSTHTGSSGTSHGGGGGKF